MAEEVYKILQGRLRLKQAKQDTCGSDHRNDQYDCDGCSQHSGPTKHHNDSDSARRKQRTSTASTMGEDPLSHKIIEKRRRDRMNSCLADLSHLIPSNYLKKGRGRIEKTEIVEMAIKHIKHLQELLPTGSNKSSSSGNGSGHSSQTETGGPESAISADEPNSKSGSNWQCPQEAESFKNGFSECVAETVHFLVEKEHIPPENPLCARLVNHLKRHLEQKPGLASAAAAGSSGAGSGASGAAANGSNATNMGEVKPSTASMELDSDYGSFSDVGSIASTQSSTISTVLNSQRHYPRVQRMIQHHHSASGTMSESSVDMKINKDGSTSQNNFLVKRRSSDEQGGHGPGGKFKFKDSIRERFSHEFSEAKAENATATSDYFMGSHAHPSISSSSKVSSSHQEFYAKRRRPSRMECDESGSEVNSSTSQASFKSQIQSEEIKSDVKKERKSVPIFALHPKGSHYIPLSVTEEVIQPYLHLFDQGTELPLMLHPITISVNFCGPIRIAAGVRSAAHISHQSVSHRTSQVAASGAEFLQQQQKTKKPDQTKLEFPDFSMR